MTEGVKFAAFAQPPAVEGGGKARRDGDRGAFDLLFRSSRHGKAERGDAARSRHPAPSLEPPPHAKLEAAIAATDGARRAGAKDMAIPLETDTIGKAGREDKIAPEASDETGAEDVVAAPVMALVAETLPRRQPAADEAKRPSDAGEADAPKLPDTSTTEVETRVATADDAQAVEVKSSTVVEAREAPPTRGAAQSGTVAGPAPRFTEIERPAVMASPPADRAATPAVTPPSEIDSVEGPRVAAPVAAAAGAESPFPRGGDSGKGAASERRNGDRTVPARVTVVAEQTVPAPAIAATTTASTLLAGLTGDSGWQNSVRSVASAQHQANQISNAPLHSMKLQLHPAELGMVTANLRFAGGQLSVELAVENRDAYDRLKGDSETIVKSLRALGYEIDQVSVQQPQIANNTTGRTETNFSATGNSARDPQASGQSGQGNGGDRLGGQSGGRGQFGGGGRGEGNAQTAQDRAGRGIYI